MVIGKHIHNQLACKNIKCSKQKTQTSWMDTKTRPIYMMFTWNPLLNEGHTQTESEGMEKDIPCKRKSKESWSSNSHIRQNRL